MKTSLKKIAGFALCLLLMSGNALTQVQDERLALQRKDFISAEKAFKQGKQSRYQKLKVSLQDYPLYPYLEYKERTHRLSTQSNKDIRSFLTTYEGTPFADRLRASWLNHLGKHARWQRYLGFYVPDKSTKRQCYYLQALLQTGQQQQALPQVEPLWLRGRSQPDACDPVFAAWRDAGKLSSQLVWQRIALAMDARQTKLARYLRRFLAKQDDQRWLDRWLEVHRNPKRVLRKDAFSGDHPYRNAILSHGIQRLAYKDGIAALHAWRVLKERYHFSPEQKARTERGLGLALARSQHEDTLLYLEQLEPAADDTKLQDARIRAALGLQEWETALNWIEALPQQQRTSEQWTYWKGRALEALGDQLAAKKAYRSVARERSYYGFLAADRLGVDYRLDHIALDISDATLERLLATLPGLQRAREFYALDRLTWARREWHAVTTQLETDALKTAAKLAQRWGWHDRAIFSLARTGYWDDLELRFPLKHRAPIERQASKQALDSAWVFAVVRQESAFIRDARSGAGAQGLMQLMPRTAKSVATKLRMKRRPNLFQPSVNIQLGTAYLRGVLDELDQHPVLATAAYNAGPHRVKSWLPERETAADIWIEAVPFTETRNYLKRVLAYTVIYEQRLGREPARLETRMPPIQVPATIATSTDRSAKDQS